MPESKYVIDAITQLEGAQKALNLLLDHWAELENSDREEVASLETDIDQTIHTLEELS